MATDYTDPQAVQAVNSAADAFEKSVSEPVPQATEVPPPSPTEPLQTEKAQEAGSPPVAEAPVAAAPEAPQESEAYRNFIAKFNGDKDAAAQAWWETNNRAAEQARKLAEYEEKEKQRASNAPEPTPTPAPEATPAELKRYDDDIRGIEDTYRTTKTEITKFEAEEKRLDKEIGSIVRQLASRDLTLDRDALQEKLVTAHDEKAAVQNYVGSLKGQLGNLSKEWNYLDRQRELTTRVLAQEREVREAREAKARSEDEAENQAIRTRFNGTIDKLTSDESIVPAILQARANKAVRRAMWEQLATQKPIADIEKFTRDEIADFLSGVKEYHSAQSAEYARQKRADSELSAPTGPAAVASETKKPQSDWTKEQWERHIQTVQL